MTRQEWLRDDPYIDVPLFESADELEQLERKHGICETCGELTSDVDEIICRNCEGADHE